MIQYIMELNPGEFDLLVKRRRSVFPKDYTGERVDDSLVMKMIEHANLAPTHKLTEPWRFVVFTGEGLRKLAEFQAACYQAVTTQNGTFREQRYESLKTKPLESSHIIACGMKRDPNQSVPEIEEIGAVFCAIENMYLTAAAHGVGCYLSTGGITYFAEAKEFFGLGQEDRLLGFLNIGVARVWPEPSRRKPAADKLKWIDH